MAANDLTLRERSALLVLMAQAKVVTNPQLKEQFAVDLPKPSREKLKMRGLIHVSQVRSPKTKRKVLALELTDRGWGWAANEVTADRPFSGASQGALYAILHAVSGHMKRKGLVLAEVFGDLPSPTAVPAAQVEQQIRTAYGELAQGDGDWVRLANLRNRLNGIPRATVDQTLKRLFDERTVNLIPNDNAKDLVPADRAAAIQVGGDDMHLVLVG